MASQKKKTDWGWPLIIVLFVIGAWPIALVLLLVKLFKNDGQKQRVQAPPLSGQQHSGQTAAPGHARSAVQTAMQSPPPKKSNAAWLKVAGIVLLVVGIIGMTGPIDALFWSDYWFSLWLPELLQFLAVAVGGGAMLGAGVAMDRRLKRYARYLAVMGEREAMPVDELARTLGFSSGRVERDLEKMVEKGYFGPAAYLNVELGYLFRSSRAMEELRAKQAAQAAQAPKEAEEGYSGILRSIRRANDAIADPVLSAKISRLRRSLPAFSGRWRKTPRRPGASAPSSTITCPPPKSCWTLTQSLRPPAWRGRTCARQKNASSPPWMPSSGASSTSWTSCTRRMPWMWTATSGSWRPCSGGIRPRWRRTSAWALRWSGKKKHKGTFGKADPVSRARLVGKMHKTQMTTLEKQPRE